jgi:uncharacterized protein DUF5134
VTPAWVLDALVALMLVVAAVSAARVALSAPWRRDASVADTDVAHLLMAIAMAGMLAPSLGTLPGTAWQAVFALLAAWFAGRVARDVRSNGRHALAGGHCAPHLVHSASMLYMSLAATAPAARTGGLPAGMGAMRAGTGSAAMTMSLPVLGFLFAFILVGYAVWDLDQLSGRRYATASRVSFAGAGPAGIGGARVGPVGIGPAEAGALAVPAAVASEAQGPRQAVDMPGTARADGAADAGACSARSGDASAADDRSFGALQRGCAAGFLLSPAVTVGCRVAMGVTMAFMLLIAL